MLLLVGNGFSFWKVVYTWAVCDDISKQFLPSWVISVPRSLKVSRCLNFVPFTYTRCVWFSADYHHFCPFAVQFQTLVQTFPLYNVFLKKDNRIGRYQLLSSKTKRKLKSVPFCETQNKKHLDLVAL